MSAEQTPKPEDTDTASETSDGPSPSGKADAKSKTRVPADCKVTIHLRATGDAPILKRNKFKVSGGNNFAGLIELLRKQLRFKENETLFLFVNTAFSPSPEEVIWDVYECFKTENELVINYSTVDAYG